MTSVRGVAEAQRRDPDHPPVEWIGDIGPVFADPARLKTTLLSFMESLVWWGRDGAIVVDADARGQTLVLHAWRPVAELRDDEVEALFTPRRPGEGAGSKIGLFVARGRRRSTGRPVLGSVEDGRLGFHLELPAGPNDPGA